MKKGKRRISIKTKLTVSMILVLVTVIGMICLVNYVFLPNYYRHKKTDSLVETYNKVNKVISKDEDYAEGLSDLSSDSTLNIDILRENSSATVYVMQINNILGSIQCSFDYPADDALTGSQREILMEMTKEYVLGEDASNSMFGDRIFDFFNDGNTISGNNNNNSKEDRPPKDKNIEPNSKEKISSRDNYAIYMTMDNRIGSEYIELFGKSDVGSFIYVRMNYQSMTENVEIFNQFIGYVAIFAIFITLILMIIISNSFTKPILKITDIAKKMADLDFEVRYPVTTSDEIGELGQSINVLSETLENTISELKTANNELQKDIENKNQIDEMRKEFLSNVSHELKTPIALIQGYAEGLQDNISDDEESREFYCDVIIDEANKMNNMVKKLLNLNQIEFGKDGLDIERFDLTEVIKSVVNSASLLAKQKGADIIMEDYEPVYVWADEYMLEEVITNYVSNAVNHVAGEMKIVINVEKHEENVRVSVFNTGEQIPEDELDKVWIKFYKVDKARTREYGGSGIGLSIVKAVMDAMHQKCGVFNHDDGVEFWFEADGKGK